MDRVLIKGGCDVDAISFYLDFKRGRIYKEGSAMSSHGEVSYVQGHTERIMMAIDPSTRTDSPLEDAFSFNTLLSNPSQINGLSSVAISLLPEASVGVYCHNKTGRRLIYGWWNENHLQSGLKLFNDVELFAYEDFYENYSYVGRNEIDRTVSNLERIVSVLPSRVKVIFILGPCIHGEKYEANPVFSNASDYFLLLNKAVMTAFSHKDNIYFIDPNPYIQRCKHWPYKRYFFTGCQSVSHYKRKVYWMMARALHKIDSGFKISFRNELKRDVNKALKVLKRPFHCIFGQDKR